MAIALIMTALFIIVWALTVCGANEEDDNE